MRRALLFLLFFAACGSPELGDRCENNESCPNGQYCSRVAVCTQSCEPEVGTTCPEGSACKTIDGRAICLRSCSADDACNDTESCQDGVCRIKDPLEPF